MRWSSVWAVLAGILVAIVVTTMVDIGLHAAGVYPPLGEPISHAQALLATGYRVVIGIAAAWLTAWLAPRNPMKHAMILGGLGMVVALAGVVLTWNQDLGPRWYPIALVVLALPQSWAGATLFLRQSAPPGRPS
jgi:hypothetical protein